MPCHPNHLHHLTSLLNKDVSLTIFSDFLDFGIERYPTPPGFSHTNTQNVNKHHEKSKTIPSSSPTYNSYVVSILLYIVLRATIHVVAISEERICPDNTIITGYTCDRNVWGFVFSSLVLPLSSAVSQSHRFQMTVFPFFLLTDIMFEIQPIPFLIVLHHVVCLVGHFMIWNTNRAVVLEYCKILVSFEFALVSKSLRLVRRLTLRQVGACWYRIELGALYFASRLGIRMGRWKSKYHIISRQSVLVKVFNVLSVSLLCICTVGFADHRSRP